MYVIYLVQFFVQINGYYYLFYNFYYIIILKDEDGFCNEVLLYFLEIYEEMNSFII